MKKVIEGSEVLSDFPINGVITGINIATQVLSELHKVDLSEAKELLQSLHRRIYPLGPDKPYYLCTHRSKEGFWWGGYYSYTAKDWYLYIDKQPTRRAVKAELKNILF